jgi:bleomycin hydrolase
MFMMMKKWPRLLILLVVPFLSISLVKAQDQFIFTTEINAEATSVEDQKVSGTCWSFSTNSFLESEMIRMGKEPVELADLFTARNAYVEKGFNYVRMHGAVNLGDGGTSHDVINMYKKYGALPKEVYKGNGYGTLLNSSDRLNNLTRSILEKVIKSPNGKLDSSWKKQYVAAIDHSMGAVPAIFNYQGKTYTPQTFAKEVVGIVPEDYVELSSFTNVPYYKQNILMVPDNWSFDKVYNIKLDDITEIIDNALRSGFTVAWAADITEKSFSWKNGVAFIPEKNVDDMSGKEKSELFKRPGREKIITAEMRQQAFDDYETTDDHGMQITGLAKDQSGKEYYIVKNSWGTKNVYKGYIYVTKAYVQYKTTVFLLNKMGIPRHLLETLNLL